MHGPGGRRAIFWFGVAVRSWDGWSAPAAPRPAVNILLGIGLKVTSALAFTVMSTLVKLVSAQFPIGEIVFYRSFFALAPLMAWLAARGEIIDAVRTPNLVGHLRRSLAGSCAMFSGFAALSFLPLPEATALGYATPILATTLAALLLGERVHSYRWIALGVGFLGMVVMLAPYFQIGPVSLATAGDRSVGAAFGLLGAAFGAVASVEVRRLAQSEKTGAIVFYFSAAAALFGLIAGQWFGWVSPGPRETLILVSAGIMGGIGQILLTSSYRFAPVSIIAPFDYTTLLWSLLLGFAVFGELPEPLVLAGAGLVILAGLFVIWHERRLSAGARRAAPADPSAVPPKRTP